MANPAEKEGFLHVHRQHIISNKSLFQSANSIGLSQYIQVRPFTFKLWRPPNFTVLPHPPVTHDSQLTEMSMEHSAPKRTDDAGGERSSNTASPTVKKEPVDVLPSLGNNGELVIDVSDAKGKINKKKKRSDDESTQWLGDKVSLQQSSTTLINSLTCP